MHREVQPENIDTLWGKTGENFRNTVMNDVRTTKTSVQLEIEHLQERIRELEEMERTHRSVVEIFKESEESFRALAENSHDIIIRFSDKFKCLYVNPVFEKVTGTAPKNFLGRTLQDINFPKDLTRRVEEAVAKVFSTGKVFSMEYAFEGIDIDWLFMPEFTSDGRVKAVISSLRDISRIKQAQETHRNSVRLKATQELARAIAHEFRQPLASLKLVADLVAQPGIDHGASRDQIAKVSGLVARMDALVAKMLNITQCSTKPYVQQLDMLDFTSSAQPQNDQVSEQADDKS